MLCISKPLIPIEKGKSIGSGAFRPELSGSLPLVAKPRCQRRCNRLSRKPFVNSRSASVGHVECGSRGCYLHRCGRMGAPPRNWRCCKEGSGHFPTEGSHRVHDACKRVSVGKAGGSFRGGYLSLIVVLALSMILSCRFQCGIVMVLALALCLCDRGAPQRWKTSLWSHVLWRVRRSVFMTVAPCPLRPHVLRPKGRLRYMHVVAAWILLALRLRLSVVPRSL